MRVEVIAVGSELLLGQITNTNATYISARLAEIGVNVYYHTVVGDNPSRLENIVKLAEKRADVLIFSGGLGPTKDDMTKETIARHIDVELVHNEEALEQIEQYFIRSGRKMTENNKKQALVFQGGTVLVNRTGMAPGMAIERNGLHYILLPGPPHEMQPMFASEAIPYLMGVNGKQEVITSRVLKFYGIGESELEHRIEDILDQQTNPTVAPLATSEAVTLRITAKSSTIEEANKLIQPVETAIRTRVGHFIYGIDDETLASKAAQLLKRNGWTIAAAESLTAGLFMAELASEPGISASLPGGVVVYNEEAKIEQLGIRKELLDTHGIVSSECAAALAIGVKRKFSTSVGVGITGAAGPTTHDGKPVGSVWIGIALKDEAPQTYKLVLSGSRNANRSRSAKFALYYLIKYLSSYRC